MALDFTEMQEMQCTLQEKYLDRWGGVNPRKGRDKLLWMMIEAGEAADLIKKCGDEAIMEDPETRHAFMEELSDVMMYFNDILLCYDIDAADLETVYREKFKRNLTRW